MITIPATWRSSAPRRPSSGLRAERPDPTSENQMKPVTIEAAAANAGSPVASNPRRQASTSLTWWGSPLAAAARATSIGPSSSRSDGVNRVCTRVQSGMIGTKLVEPRAERLLR